MATSTSPNVAAEAPQPPQDANAVGSGQATDAASPSQQVPGGSPQVGSYPNASLYVGDLETDPEVSEGHLFQIFSQIGAVMSIRVCRDAITRRSLGYAYVNYRDAADAKRALDTLNNYEIRGRPCRVMWSQRDPSVRRSGVGNIFIKNLDKDIDVKALHDTFAAFGSIQSCKIATDENGNSKGYGFVHFETQDMADTAIERVNGMQLNGKVVTVTRFIPKKDRKSSSDESFVNVYVKNIPAEWDDDKLNEVFAKYGEITSCAVMRDHEGNSRGFGFVNFESAEQAAAAVEELNGNELVEGKPMYVGRAQKKSERAMELKKKFEAAKMERASKYQGTNVYVKNLDDAIDDEKLSEAFAEFGTITSAKVMRDDKTDVSRGFGFVCFSNAEEATRAIAEMNGKLFGTKPLYVALAQRKEVRKMQLEAQHAQKFKGAPGANGMPGAMYGGAPMFFPAAPNGMPPAAGGFIYPPAMMPRNARWPQQFQPMPQYIVPVQQRGRQQRVQRGGRNFRQQQGAVPQGFNQQPFPMQGMPPAALMQQQAAQQAAQQRGQGDVNGGDDDQMQQQQQQQHMFIAERLYPLIAKTQPELAGKITGMLIDATTSDELIELLENPDALESKIQEAIQVLNAATEDDGQDE